VVETGSFAGTTVPNLVGGMRGDRICNAAPQDWVQNDLGMAWRYLDTNLVYKRSNQVSCVLTKGLTVWRVAICRPQSAHRCVNVGTWIIMGLRSSRQPFDWSPCGFQTKQAAYPPNHDAKKWEQTQLILWHNSYNKPRRRRVRSRLAGGYVGGRLGRLTKTRCDRSHVC
jgi:hypothetical protein